MLYEEKICNKLDSRTIPPPRPGNHTERIVCESTSDEAIFSYAKAHVHSTIYWFKYKRDEYTIKFLSRILIDEILWMTSDKLESHNWIVTYAPSTSHHLGDKKWDHNEDIFEEMKKIIDFNFLKIFGFVDKEMTSSKKLNKKQRTSAKKFSLLPGVKIPENSGLIIFDDVKTTGGTLKNLAELAKKLEPQIVLVVAISH